MILLRHAESEFNEVYSVSGVDPGIEDPRLTARGHRQAREAAARLAEHPVTRVLASPYTRALETADALAAALSLPITIEPLVRERGAFACDIGTGRSELARRWPHLDFSHIDECWWSRATESDAAVKGAERDVSRGRGGLAPARRRVGHHPLGLHPRTDRPVREELRDRAVQPALTGRSGPC